MKFRHIFVALAIVGLGYVAFSVIHEMLHWVINVLATGQITTCSSGLPFGLQGPRLYTCVEDSSLLPYNAMVTPYASSVLGLIAMVLSDDFDTKGKRWGVFSIGLIEWSRSALYGMGILTRPMLDQNGVEYVGDGVMALEAFGRVAQLPGVVLLLIGCVVVLRKTNYNKSGKLP